MKTLAPRFLVAIATCVVAFACGNVPTFADGVAYISPLQLPSLAVLAGDTLRDSLGRVAPLKVDAFDQNDNIIPGVMATFVVITLPPGVNIDANGITTAIDSLRRVQIVARVGDRIQTTATNLEVVAQPDLLARTGPIESIAANTPSSALQVTVTGNRNGTRVPVNGIVVRYKIVSTFPIVRITDSVFFFTEGVRGDLTQTRDTTDAGVTSRAIIATSVSGIDTIFVEASARDLKGKPITPVRFAIPVKKGT